jgi:DNA-binding MarR family transcriptional regulator
MSAQAATSSPRQQRVLSPQQTRVQNWIKKNHGALSEIAREMGLSVSFVQRIAYNLEARSKGLRVEHKLRSRGCPLIQRIN